MWDPDEFDFRRAAGFVAIATGLAAVAGYLIQGSIGGGLVLGLAVGVGVALGLALYEAVVPLFR